MRPRIRLTLGPGNRLTDGEKTGFNTPDGSFNIPEDKRAESPTFAKRLLKPIEILLLGTPNISTGNREEGRKYICKKNRIDENQGNE